MSCGSLQGRAQKLHSNRNTVRGKSSWNHDRGKTRGRRQLTVEARLAVPTDHARLTCERWVNKGVDPIVSHRLQNRLADSADFERMFQIAFVSRDSNASAASRTLCRTG